MPKLLYNTCFLLLIVLTIFVAREFISDILTLLNKKKAKSIRIYIELPGLFAILVLCASFFHYISTTLFNLEIQRDKTVISLREMARKQEHLHEENGRYALSFKELGYESQGLKSNYTFYLNGDEIHKYHRYDLPNYIKNDNLHIYAVFAAPWDPSFGEDVLSVDFKGNIILIESIKFWPLPEPKWHKWK